MLVHVTCMQVSQRCYYHASKVHKSRWLCELTLLACKLCKTRFNKWRTIWRGNTKNPCKPNVNEVPRRSKGNRRKCANSSRRWPFEKRNYCSRRNGMVLVLVRFLSTTYAYCSSTSITTVSFLTRRFTRQKTYSTYFRAELSFAVVALPVVLATTSS
jgi:hypothetical protein